MQKFWTQAKAPGGNWYDVLGSDDESTCVQHAIFMQEQGDQTRVIERCDMELWEGEERGKISAAETTVPLALLGAIEMLSRIAKGESFGAIEYFERLARYENALLRLNPQWKKDPYYGKFFKHSKVA